MTWQAIPWQSSLQAAFTTIWGSGVSPIPSLDLNFTLGSLDPRITYTGASLATLTDATGAIAYKPHNLLTHSSDFTNAAWGKTGVTVSSQVLTVSASGGSKSIVHAATIPAGVACFAIKVRAVSSSRVAFGAYNAGFLANTCTIVSGPGTITGTTLRSLAGLSTTTWTVVYISITAPASATDFYIYPGADSSGTNAAGDSVEVSYAQLNVGPLQPYYPTTSAAYYGPRFTYDPVTHAALGLLIEEQRSNLCRNSEALNGTGWTSTNQSVTLAAGTAPDGTSNANRLTATAGSGAKQTYNTVGSATTVTTNTIYAKAGTANWIALAFDVQGVTDGAFFNLATGVVGTVAASTTASITPVGNGWYRCSVTRTYASAHHDIDVEIHTADAQGVIWAAAGTETVLVWGAQLEAGAFATSYIPTTSASVTRAADSATMTGSNFSSWFNATQGTFVTEDRPTAYSTTPIAFCVNSDNQGVASNGGGVAQQWNGTSSLSTGNSIAAGGRRSVAMSYSAGARALCLNSGAIASSASTAFGNTPTAFAIGAAYAGESQYANGPIARLRYYNTALTNAQLQALTT